jgi:hypothetical protein
MRQGKPGAFLAQNVGAGLGVGVGLVVGLGDGERPRLAPGWVATCWLAGLDTLHPAMVSAAARQQSAAVRRAWRCMPARI